MSASPFGHPARSEPLLWLQLLAVGVLPLEALAILLVLAGTDPGPLPALERLLAWAIGALAPALLLWRRPADVWSLLLLQTPLRGRRLVQRRLSGLQDTLALRVAMAAAAAGALPLLWWLDAHAAVASPFSPLNGTPRLVALLLAAALLAVMLWQWQQLLQALWLLSRPAPVLEAGAPLEAEGVENARLSLGLPLLLPDPLRAPVPAPPPAAAPAAASGGSAVAVAVAVEPEQPAEEPQGPDLDQQVD